MRCKRWPGGQGIAPERVVYVPNGAGISEQFTVDSGQWTVDSGQFTGDSGQVKRRTLLLYSRLFEFDVGRLATVLRGVKTAVPNLKVLSVGTGLYADDAAQLRQQLAAADLLEAVEDKGWVAEAELPTWLRQADVGLYLMDDTCSNRTKCPVKLADMLMLGIPVVGEAVGQVSAYVVQGETGLLRSSGDTAGLIDDLSRLLQEPDTRAHLAANGRSHYAAHFSWPHLAARLETLYALA
ncbi:MAG: glycosyltransferase [Chloroflexi bacterium]|nr:glycosyltransferase [Chloroflexota bacterium]